VSCEFLNEPFSIQSTIVPTLSKLLIMKELLHLHSFVEHVIHASFL